MRGKWKTGNGDSGRLPLENVKGEWRRCKNNPESYTKNERRMKEEPD